MALAPTRLALVDDLHRFGGAAAVCTSDDVITYAQLAGLIGQTRERLGSTRRLVLVTGANTVGFLAGYLGALAGGHVVLLVQGDNPEHLQGWIRRYDPDVVVRAGTDQPRLQVRRSGTAHVLHDELALLLSTSGTTGSAKLVRLSYAAVQANAEAIAASLDIGPDDRAVTTLPMAYCYGLSVLHSHLVAGASLVLTDLSVADACFWDLVRRRRVTSLAGVPYTYELLDSVGFLQMDLPHLRDLTQAGGRMPAERVTRYATSGRRLHVMYGQTEATARIACLPPQLAAAAPGSIGRPLPGGDLVVLPAGGGTQPVPDGVEGELVYRGPNVMMGYATGPADLALGSGSRELRTGDRGRRLPDGLFEVTGRPGRTVKLFGLRVDLDVVQSQLDACGWRAWCTETRGAVGVLTEDPADAVREAACAATGLPPHSVVVRQVEALPRTANGKIDTARAGAELSRAVPRARAGDVAAVYAEVLAVPVGPDDTFVGLGGDSLSYVEVALRLEDLLPEIPPDWPSRTVGALQARAAAPADRATQRAATSVDTTVLLRAVGIVLVVLAHTRVSPIVGGAHSLLVVAGYNIARLRVTAAARRERAAGNWAALRRLALPTCVIIAAASLLTPGVGVVQVVQLNSVLGPSELGTAWRYWYVEALLQLILLVTLLLSVPAVDRFERRHPSLLPWGLLLAGLLMRFQVVSLDDPYRRQSALALLWLFALGWCIERSRTRWQRCAASAAAALLLPGYFPDLRQGLVVLAAALLVTWSPRLPLPLGRGGRRFVGMLASSSLFIYLAHWQMLDWTRPYLRDTLPLRLVAFALCLAFGVLVWRAWGRAALAVTRIGQRERLPESRSMSAA